MALPISRGRIAHTVPSELAWWGRSLVSPLSDQATIHRAERAFAEHIGRSECIVFPFARTAIWATLRELDLPQGSRVVMPPLTIKPILDVVVELGLDPLFVDLDPLTACFDEEQLSLALQARPAVAILTYLFGLVPNVNRIMSLLRRSGVFVIEDFSQCLNGQFDGRKIGTYGDVAVYSASSVKTFDTFGGGFALADDPDLISGLRRRQAELSPAHRADLLRSISRNILRNVASSRAIFPFVTFPLLRLAARYSSRAVGRFTGARNREPLSELPAAWFRRYTSLQARVAIAELPRVAARDARRRRAVIRMIADSDVSDRPTGEHGQEHVYWQFIVYVSDFEKARELLSSHGIDCATTSLVLLTDLPSYPSQTPTPTAQRLYNRGVYLPCYHQLRDSEIARLGAAIRELQKLP